MKAIPREAGRITYSTEIRKLKQIAFDEYQKAVIIGCVLGDGYLEENWSKTNYRLNLCHSIKQKEYVMWKANILQKWIISKPYLHKSTKSLRIRTVSHEWLTFIQKIFYENKLKRIPENIEDFLLNPITLAVWFMDDGNVRKYKGSVNSFDLNTQSFTLEENERLIDALKKVYGLKTTINLNNGYHRIHVLSADRFRFRNIIESFIIESIRYKLG